MHVSIILSVTTSTTNWPGIVLTILFFVAVIALMLSIPRFARHRAQRVATARGWGYTKRDDTMLSHFQTWPFYLGDRQHADSVITGVFEGRFVTLFNFSFRNSPGDVNLGIGPILLNVDGHPKRVDTGIFGGFDMSLGIATGRSRMLMGNRRRRTPENWGICVMEMPGTLTPVLIRPAFSVDGINEMFSHAIGLTNGDDQATQDLPIGDVEFDKKFLVRAEERRIATALLPKATMDLLLENRNLLIRHSVHFWTWDRYLFSLGNMPLSEKSVNFRLPIMAKMIENLGQ